jgi:hypothetical protein
VVKYSLVWTEVIQALRDARHNAQLALDAAYKALVEQASHPKPELDDEEAELTDDSDAESDNEGSTETQDLDMTCGDDDEDDDDYVPHDK